MRWDFDARRLPIHRDPEARWKPPTVVEALGAFAMPIGPVFSDFAESAHFLLETVGEDVIRTIPRLFYKYRGVEKVAEGQPIDRALLLAERFSGTSAFAHGLAFCQAVEAICGIEVPPRSQALRTVFAELERLRHHAAVITGICNSTALAVATSQAALIEEDLLRLTCEAVQHRYFFGTVKSVSLDGETKMLSAGEGLLITGVKTSVLKAGSGGPSNFLHFFLAPLVDLDRSAESAPAAMRELYRTATPIPDLKPGDYDLNLTRVTFPAQMPSNLPHHRSGAALYLIISGTGANTVDGKTEAGDRAP
jgi:hypothetical protein